MPDSPTFMIDHMLIKLGKYLRILGYDAEWRPGVRTHELISRANIEDRIFLTRNTHLPHQYPQPDRLVVIAGTDPVDQLRQLVAELELDVVSGLFSKCIRCNVALEPVPDKSTIEDAVHPNVYRRFDQFYTCPSCETVFWHGTHARNTCEKLGLVSS